MKQMDGIEIDYLVVVNEKLYESGGHSTQYGWYNQDDVFLDKDELLRKII